MNDKLSKQAAPRHHLLRLMAVTVVGIFTAEVLVMLLVEGWGGRLPVLVRVFLDASLLMVCVFPGAYFLVFHEMLDQAERSQRIEQALDEANRSLEGQVAERTCRLQRANEDLLGEVRERARLGMALGQRVKEAERGQVNLRAVLDGLDDGLLVVDASGTVQLANRAAERLLSAKGQPLPGQALATLFGNSAREILAASAAGGNESAQSPEFPQRAREGAAPVTVVLASPCLWEGEPARILRVLGRAGDD